MLTLSLDKYEDIFRPLLFRLPAETSQNIAEYALRHQWLWRGLGPITTHRDKQLESEYCGIKLKNPIGLAAGFDKNCEMIPALANLGFGYLTVGTVTEEPRAGNTKPRLLRIPEQRAILNALGFPGTGLVKAAHRLEEVQHLTKSVPIVVSISGTTEDQIVRCHRRLEPICSAIEINISSPNTAGLKVFQQPDNLTKLLDAVNKQREHPLAVKLPPFVASNSSDAAAQHESVLALAKACNNAGIDAVTIANSLPTKDQRMAVGMGGVSGKPIFNDMLDMVRAIRSEIGTRLSINACGGIFTGQDAADALSAGATTVQLYTGMVYRGPWVANKIGRELSSQMMSRGFRSLDQFRIDTTE